MSLATRQRWWEAAMRGSWPYGAPHQRAARIAQSGRTVPIRAGALWRAIALTWLYRLAEFGENGSYTWARQMYLRLGCRMHRCAGCQREFLLDRWNLGPPGWWPVCPRCRPAWVPTPPSELPPWTPWAPMESSP